LWQNLPKNAKRAEKHEKAHSSPRATAETTNSRNAEIGTNVAHGLRMMLCFASIIHNTKSPAETVALEALALSWHYRQNGAGYTMAHSNTGHVTAKVGVVFEWAMAIHNNMTSLTYVSRS